MTWSNANFRMDANLLLISAEQGGSCGELWGAMGSCGELWGDAFPAMARDPVPIVQAEMVESQDLGLKTCSDKSFFCVPLCRDLPSPVNTLIWDNVPSLPNVTPQDKFHPESFKINCKKIQCNQFRGYL